MIPETLEQVLLKLKNCNPQTRVLAVSKLQSVEKIRELYQQGQRLFAENYVQEAVEKQAQLQNFPVNQKIHWHFIGRLQKNKVKQVIGNFELIHSVDSLELAEVFNRKAQEKGLQQKILLQVNLSEEESKGGFSEQNFLSQLSQLSLFAKFSPFSSLQICGLMTMPPLFEKSELARPYFKKLKKIFDQLKPDFPHLEELSMGTSSDYLVAAEEGATLVRLGTILFGER